MCRVEVAKAAWLLGGVNDEGPDELAPRGIAAEGKGDAQLAQLANLSTVSHFFAPCPAWSDLPIEGCLVHVEDVLQFKSLQLGCQTKAYVCMAC